MSRFFERAKTRDAALEQNLFELYQKDTKENSLAQLMLDAQRYNPKAENDTRVFREYMAKEAI